MRLVGTTKTTLAAIRDRTHWNSQNLTPMDPVTLGLCSQIDLDFEVAKGAKANPDAVLRKEEPEDTLLPAEVTTAEGEGELDVQSVFAKLKQLKRDDQDEDEEDDDYRRR